MNLRGVDLNLLPILRALLHEPSITRAAQSLNMSQPAMSNALGRLRAILGDPLLVRVGRGMRPTERAERLRPMVERACAGIEDLLLDQPFNPGETRRQFVVAAPDYLALLLGPFLVARLVDAAPMISIRLIGAEPDVQASILAGRVDLAIVARTSAVDPGLKFATHSTNRIVGVVAVDHPLARNPPKTIADLNGWPWIGAEAWKTMFTPRDPLWPILMKASERTTLSLTYLLLLPILAARTHALTCVPKALADEVAALMPIAQFELPGPAISLELCSLWSPLMDADGGHRWFRELLAEAMDQYFRPKV